MDLTIYLGNEGKPELDLVQEALWLLLTKRQEAVIKSILNDEQTDAFYSHEDSNRLQSLLTRLTETVNEVAYTNYERSYYQQNPKGALWAKNSRSEDQEKRHAAYLEKYGSGSEAYETSTHEQEQP